MQRHLQVVTSGKATHERPLRGHSVLDLFSNCERAWQHRPRQASSYIRPEARACPPFSLDSERVWLRRRSSSSSSSSSTEPPPRAREPPTEAAVVAPSRSLARCLSVCLSEDSWLAKGQILWPLWMDGWMISPSSSPLLVCEQRAYVGHDW